MLKFYKDLYIKYFAFAFTGAIAIIILFAVIFSQIWVGIYFIPAIIYIIFCAAFFVTKASNRYKKLLDIMQADCQCERFITEYNKALLKSLKLKPATKVILDLNISTAYFNMGDFEKFKSIVSELDTDKIKNKTTKQRTQFIYFNNLAAYYVHIGDYDTAQQFIEKMKDIAEKVNHNSAEYDKMLRNVERLNGRIYIANGKYEKAESIYLYGSQYATNTITKVCSTYFLAKIYSNTQRTEEAIAAYQYVIQNGGDLYYLSCAQNALEAL